MNSERKMREALEYVVAYIEERDDWQGTDPIIAHIQKALAAPAGEQVGLTDAEVLAAARTLCKRTALTCGTNWEDEWALYCDDYKAEAVAMLSAAYEAKRGGAA